MTIRSQPATPAYLAGWDRTFGGGEAAPASTAPAGAITWDGCDAALVGFCPCADGVTRAVYDRERLVQVFQDQGMTEEDAEEWVQFNIEGAYVGAATPLLVEWRWPDRITKGA